MDVVELPPEIIALRVRTRGPQTACLQIEQFDREVGNKPMIFVGLHADVLAAIRANCNEDGAAVVWSDDEAEILATRNTDLPETLFADRAAYRTWRAPSVSFLAVLLDRAEPASRNFAADLKKRCGIDVPVRVVEV